MAKPNPPKTVSKRQLRVAETVRHALTEVLRQNDLREPILEGQIITVSEVRMSPDLHIATGYVTALGHDDQDSIVTALNDHTKTIRKYAVPFLRQMRSMPEFRFRVDGTFEEFAKINRLLNSDAVKRDLNRDEADIGDQKPEADSE